MYDITINDIFELGYFVKGKEMYIPLSEYLEIFPEEKDVKLPNIYMNTYVIISTHPNSEIEKAQLKELVKRKNNIKTLKLK